MLKNWNAKEKGRTDRPLLFHDCGCILPAGDTDLLFTLVHGRLFAFAPSAALGATATAFLSSATAGRAAAAIAGVERKRIHLRFISRSDQNLVPAGRGNHPHDSAITRSVR